MGVLRGLNIKAFGAVLDKKKVFNDVSFLI